MKPTFLPRLTALIGLILLTGLASAWSQPITATRGFTYPVYANIPSEDPGQPVRSYLRALITGQSASVRADGNLSVQGMLIVAFDQAGLTNLVARTPNCLLNRADKTAASTNRLEVDAGQGQLLIDGEGFFCNLTNFTLFLSNDVHTTIDSGLVRSARESKLLTPETALQPAPPTAANATNPPILIRSDRLHLQGLSNIVTYEGAVRVDSSQMDMACQTLVIHRATNGSIREIVAERDVVVQSKQGAGTAYGEWGVYTTQNGELLTLKGNPARWSDGPRQGQAQVFVLDLENNVLQAEHHASVQLPRQSLDRTDWVLSAPGSSPTELTDQPILISAELLTVHLPTLLRPSRSVLGQTNVIIVNQADGSRAAGDQAFYSEATGTLELDGHASWVSGDRVIRAHSLFLDRTNRFFRASGEAYLRLPLKSMGGSLTELGGPPEAERPGTAGALEVYSERYHYRDGVLRFQEEVRANLLESNRVSSRLSCQLLSVHGTNQIERVLAQHAVHLEQLPFTLPNGRMIQRWLDCQWLTLLVDTNGQPDRLIARTNVTAAKYEIRPDQPDPILTRLTAEEVTAEFMSGTNQFKQVLAERNVTLAQGLRSAFGQHALYDGATDQLVLTGQPTLDAPEGRVTEAAAILFDVSANRFSVRQVRAEGDKLPTQKPLTRQ